MLQVIFEQKVELERTTETPFEQTPQTISLSDPQLDQLLNQLTLDSNWGERQRAARKLGYMGHPEAVSALLTALPDDPFWMVRCTIIQALEKIGDARAIPTLARVTEQDAFLIVREHASKAVATLSR